VIQAWDFSPGSNFVLEMQRAAASAQRTIAILSPDYVASRFAAPEWGAAFAQDPEGLKRNLVPIRIRACMLEGMLRTIVYVDLVGLDETAARQRVLDGLLAKRGKPSKPPAFPGAVTAGQPTAPTPRPFPGAAAGQATGRAPYVPKIRGAISDLDRARFIKAAFEVIREHFDRGLQALEHEPAVDIEFTHVSQTEFIAKVFIDGKHRNGCRIWLGGMMGGNEIGYYEGRDFQARSNAVNEVLAIAREPLQLSLSALMKMSPWGRAGDDVDLDRMSPEQAADYLWRRFVSVLE